MASTWAAILFNPLFYSLAIVAIAWLLEHRRRVCMRHSDSAPVALADYAERVPEQYGNDRASFWIHQRRRSARGSQLASPLYFFTDVGQLLAVPSYVLHGGAEGIAGGSVVLERADLVGMAGILIQATDFHLFPTCTNGERIRIDRLLSSHAGMHQYAFVGPDGERIELDSEEFKASLQAGCELHLPQVRFDQEGGFRYDSDRR